MKLTGLWWWIDRWRKSTAYTDMTLEQQGAYRNLLDEAALRGGAIPDNEDTLAKACGDARRWRKLKPTLMARFTLTADGWRNATMDEVIAESKRRAEKQRDYRNRQGNGAGNEKGNESGNNQRPPDPSPVEVGKKHQPLTGAREFDPARRSHPLDERPVLSAEAVDAGDRFLAAYPVKSNQAAAKRAWIALHPDEDTISAIFANLDERARLGWHKNARYVPYPARFIEDRMWEETYIPRDSPPAQPQGSGRTVADADATADYLAKHRAARG